MSLSNSKKASLEPRVKRALWAVIFISTTCFASSALDSQTFSKMDVFELEYVADPQISPDASQIVYVRHSNDIMTDRTRSNIWIVDSKGQNHRPLLSGTESFSSPRWSPDGKRLAYLSQVEGRGPELFVRWMDTGQTALVSNLTSSPNSISWSPDGKLIAFSAFVKSTPTPLFKLPNKPEGAEWAKPPKVFDSLIFKRDGQGLIEPGFSHIFVIESQGGTARQITSGNYNHSGQLAWSQDGKEIVFSANRNDDWEYRPLDRDLWSIEVKNGRLKRITDKSGPDSSPVFSPNGKRLAFLGFEDRKMGHHQNDVYIYDSKTGSPILLTENFDRSVESVSWADSNTLYILYDDHGKRKLAALSIRGKIFPVADDIGGTSLSRPYTSGTFSVAKNGEIAYTKASPMKPSGLAFAKRGKKPKVLLHLNDSWFSTKQLAHVEEINWKSSYDSLDLQGWIVKPANFDPSKKYPLILEIHGGPFAAYGPTFSIEAQLFAAAGYVVFYCNPRGSTSYGEAFANKIHHNYPGNDHDDLMSGVDAILANGYIDEQELFITGGSGGGVLTAWAIGKTNRFAAAVVSKPVINWTSLALYSDIGNFVPTYWFEKPPWENQDEYWRRSPLSLIGNVQTPTMLITGEADHRTPMAETEQYYQALKLRKIETVLVRVPDAAHTIAARPSHQIAKVEAILAWFNKHRSKKQRSFIGNR